MISDWMKRFIPDGGRLMRSACFKPELRAKNRTGKKTQTRRVIAETRTARLLSTLGFDQRQARLRLGRESVELGVRI